MEGLFMKKVKIFTDSTAYIPQEYVDKYDIGIIPLTLNWLGKSYLDGVEIGATEFYTQLAASTELATTSAVPMGQFIEAFKPYLDEGREVFYLGFTSGLSATVEFAFQAQKAMGNPENLRIMDTKIISMALTLMVLEVCKKAEQGASLDELEAFAKDLYPRIGVYFTVDDLIYLHRGGRINTAKCLLGSVLNLKPILMIRDGKIELVESVRSKKKALKRMIDLIERDIDGRTPVKIGPFHALAYDEMIEMEEEAIERLKPVESIRSEVSPVIGSHVGPGTVSMAYLVGEE
ncbi:MAG TPA: DegV family protein, partial [Anaerolineaceae bacterium]|nr:DegV family protein [Anaerolineaceae bacterium]